MSSVGNSLRGEAGSFRDRSNKVYYHGDTVVRGLSSEALTCWTELAEMPYFKAMLARKEVIHTSILDASVSPGADVIKKGWAGALLHDKIPFITYSYEWTFGMLKDAAILQLSLLEAAIEEDWTLKDASSYNIQWLGTKPIFIDVGSFEQRKKDEPWVGYRQFCMMFLIPLLIKAHRDIDYIPLLRCNLEGIDPVEACKLFSRWSYLKKGVFIHIFMHAKMQKKYSDGQPSEKNATKKTTKHSKAMVIGTIQGLARLVNKLVLKDNATTWGEYDKNHSYDDDSFALKQSFVKQYAEKKHWPLIWDLGCNTGTFSMICSPYAKNIISMDGDHLAIEKLYQRQKSQGEGNILPLIMNLSNVSPGQGWLGCERMSLVSRGTPDLILCLALIHHIVISANIPMHEFMAWLRSLNTCVIIEFVSKEDEMTAHLLKNRVDQYPDYTETGFEEIVNKLFTIEGALSLKSGVRKIYYLEPKD